jgi:hypothetical protein
MVNRIAGATLVPAPPLTPFPQTLLSVLESRGLLHDAPAGSHLQNGVYWRSDAAADVAGNADVVYAEGEFTSEDKVPQHNLDNTTGFAFELVRLIELGIPAAGYEDLNALAMERFDAWESYDVERHVRAYFEANDTPVAGTFPPTDAAAALLNAIALVYPHQPMLFSGRGPSVRLLKDSVIELAGGIYAPGTGFGIGDTTSGKVYATGTISVWRTPATVALVPNLPVNEAQAMVERSYYVVVDGPIYSTTALFADAVT